MEFGESCLDRSHFSYELRTEPLWFTIEFLLPSASCMFDNWDQILILCWLPTLFPSYSRNQIYYFDLQLAKYAIRYLQGSMNKYSNLKNSKTDSNETYHIEGVNKLIIDWLYWNNFCNWIPHFVFSNSTKLYYSFSYECLFTNKPYKPYLENQSIVCKSEIPGSCLRTRLVWLNVGGCGWMYLRVCSFPY